MEQSSSFIPVSRGLLRHLKGLSDAEVKFYLFVLLLADTRYQGKVSGRVSNWIDYLDWSKGKIYRVINSLEEKKYLKFNRTTKDSDFSINILKYKDTKKFYKSKEIAVEIFNLYPRKENKQESIKEILKVIDKDNIEKIKKAVKDFSDSVKNTEKKFIPLASNWFKKKRWTDEIINSNDEFSIN